MKRKIIRKLEVDSSELSGDTLDIVSSELFDLVQKKLDEKGIKGYPLSFNLGINFSISDVNIVEN